MMVINKQALLVNMGLGLTNLRWGQWHSDLAENWDCKIPAIVGLSSHLPVAGDMMLSFVNFNHICVSGIIIFVDIK